MEFQKLIEERRSMRGYDEERQVTKEQIEELVEAAIQAPSWKNSQTARYYCVLDKEARERFAQECLPPFNQKNSQNAALVVTTFVENRAGFDRESGKPDNEVGNGWGFYDLGLHNANFLLKAKDMGLDTLVMGIRDAKKIRTFLEIPEEEIIVSVLAVGYGNKEMMKPKRKAVEEILKIR